jgi:hypothetical protein
MNLRSSKEKTIFYPTIKSLLLSSTLAASMALTACAGNSKDNEKTTPKKEDPILPEKPTGGDSTASKPADPEKPEIMETEVIVKTGTSSKSLIDKDKDGIPDAKDKCPTLHGPRWAHGCPATRGVMVQPRNPSKPQTP